MNSPDGGPQAAGDTHVISGRSAGVATTWPNTNAKWIANIKRFMLGICEVFLLTVKCKKHC